MATLARLASLLLLASQALFSASPATAQGEDSDLKADDIDRVVFRKGNAKHFCVPDGALRVVDKQKLRAYLNDVYLGGEAEWKDPFASWLGYNRNKTFTVHLADRYPSAAVFFSDTKNQYYIECNSRADEPEDAQSAWLKKIIVRKAPADIKAKTDDISKVNAATMSFASDGAAKTRTFSGEGLIGLSFSGPGPKDKAIPGLGPYSYSFVPYIYTKQFNLEPDSNGKPDVSYLMPGLSSNLVLNSQDWKTSLAIQFDAATTIDQEQSANYSIVTLRLSPSFTIGDKQVFRSAIPVPLFGSLVLYPELTGVVREFVVHDAGTNKDLLDKSTFTSLGYDATVLMYWADSTGLLPAWVFKAGYIYRATTEGGPDINRWTMALTVAPFSNKNVTIEAEYVSGLDENTFKDEQRWTVGLGIRY